MPIRWLAARRASYGLTMCAAGLALVSPGYAQGQQSTTAEDRAAADREAMTAIGDIADGFRNIWGEAEDSPLFLAPEPVEIDFLEPQALPWEPTPAQRVRWLAMPPVEVGLSVPPGTGLQRAWQDWFRYDYARASQSKDVSLQAKSALEWLAWSESGSAPPDIFDNPDGEYLLALQNIRNALAPEALAQVAAGIPGFDQMPPGSQFLVLSRIDPASQEVIDARRTALHKKPRAERDLLREVNRKYLELWLSQKEPAWRDLSLAADELALEAELKGDTALAAHWFDLARKIRRNEQIDSYGWSMRTRYQNVLIGRFEEALLSSKNLETIGARLFDETDPRRIGIALTNAADNYGASRFDEGNDYLERARQLCALQRCGDIVDNPVVTGLQALLEKWSTREVGAAFGAELSGKRPDVALTSSIAELGRISAAKADRLPCIQNAARQFAPPLSATNPTQDSPELERALELCYLASGREIIAAYRAASLNPEEIDEYRLTLFEAGTSAYKTGEYGEAEDWLSAYVETTSEHDGYQRAIARSLLAALSIAAGQWQEAERRNEAAAESLREARAAGAIGAADYYGFMRNYDRNRVEIMLAAPASAHLAFELAADRARDERDERQDRSRGLSGESSFAGRLAYNASFTNAADAAFARYALETSGQALPVSRYDSLETGFAALQDALTDRTSIALAQAIAEQGFPGVEGEVQRLIERRRALVEQTAGESSSANAYSGFTDLEASQEDRFRAARRSEFERIDSQIEQLAPDYFRMIRPLPMKISQATRLLGEREAALLILPGERGTHVMLVSRNSVEWHRSDWTAKEVDDRVRRLRWFLGAGKGSIDEDEEELWATSVDGELNGFDRDRAHELYRALIAPVAGGLASLDNLVVIAGGPMSSLPLSVLVTEPPQGRDDDPQALRESAWLGDRVPLSYLPSLQSLAFLRRGDDSAPDRSQTFMIGFGDPQLSGEDERRGARGSAAGSGSFANADAVSAVLDPALLRRKFTNLPGTRTELEALAQGLPDVSKRLFMGPENTETSFKSVSGQSFNLVVVATHAVVTGEFEGAVEPGLIFTPPAVASSRDDGYLSASEVAALKLRADWIILSACNTAAGDGSAGAAGLSGLARAFFYAGAQSLLVTHWPLRDDVAPRLTLSTVTGSRGEGAVSRVQALQRAVSTLRGDSSKDLRFGSDGLSLTYAHPAAWAPFVLIGDGLQ